MSERSGDGMGKRALLACAALLLLAVPLASAPPAAGDDASPAGRRIYRVATPDGADLGLERIPGDGPPVLLLHGLGTNSRTFALASMTAAALDADGGGGSPARDVLAYWGLAEHLRRRRFDVWLLNFRGAGRGEAASRLPEGAKGWTIDDHAVEDLPAAYDLIARETGQRPFLVGHSMGGLVIDMFLLGARRDGRAEDEPAVVLDRELGARRQRESPGVVLVAPALRMAWKKRRRPVWAYFPAQLELLLRRPQVPDRIPLARWTLSLRLSGAAGKDGSGGSPTAASRAATALLESSLAPIRGRSETFLRKVLGGVVDSCSRGELLQFVDGIRTGSMRSTGTPPVDYGRHASEIDCPLLVVVGRRDSLVDAGVVIDTLAPALARSPSRSLAAVFDDFGHLDLLLSRRAPRHVYPVIETWLSVRAAESGKRRRRL